MSELGKLEVDLESELETYMAKEAGPVCGETMGETAKFAIAVGIGAGVGAGLMFLFDPNRGKARRATVRDKALSLRNKTQRIFRHKLADVENRVHGLELELKRRLECEIDASDEVLVPRVRAKLGRLTDHSHAIEVTAKGGVVVLKGKVLVGEADRILDGLRSVPGVMSVNNQMAMFEAAAVAR